MSYIIKPDLVVFATTHMRENKVEILVDLARAMKQ